MQETKIFSGGGMDSNTTVEAVGTNDYLDAEFIRTLVTDGNDAGMVNSVDGTVLIENPNKSSTDSLVNGKYFKDIGKVVLFYRGEQDRIDLFDPSNNSFEVLVDGTSFGLDDVKDIKLVDKKLLIWNNGKSEIKCINIERAPYILVNPDTITLYKNSPVFEPSVRYVNNESIDFNNLKGSLFQFRTQYVYKDHEMSSWSPISVRPAPTNEGNPDFSTINTLYNSIIVESFLLDAEYAVDRVRTAMRVGNGDWYIIDDSKVEDIESLPNVYLDTQVNSGVTKAYNPTTNTYGFVFSNNGLYEHVDVFETDLLYDHLPREASAIEVVNKNTLLVAGGREGYPRPDINTPLFLSTLIIVDEPEPPDDNTLPVLSIANNEFPPGLPSPGNPITNGEVDGVITFGGNDPEVGDTLNLKMTRYRHVDGAKMDDWPTLSYTFTSGDIALGRSGAINAAAQDFVSQANSILRAEMSGTNPDNVLHIYMKYVRIFDGTGYKYHVTRMWLSKANTIAGKRSTPTLKMGSSYQLALAHYDAKWRPFPIVTDSDWIVNTVTREAYNDGTPGTTYQPVIVPSFTPGTTPPEGAVYYQWLITENTKFQKWVDVEGEYTGTSVTDNTISINLTDWMDFIEDDGANQVGYEFSEGDRAIIYQKNGGDYTNIDVSIKSFEFINSEWILKVDNPSEESYVTGDTIRLELYTPRKNTIDTESKVFYSLPPVYTIQDGEYADTVNILEADNYLKVRSGQIVEDPSFSDYYPSNHYSFGMPRTYYDTPEDVTYESRIRYSREYVFGSQINGINRFYPEAFRDYDYTFGKIQYLTARANRVVCVQELNTGYIGVYRNILETAEAQASVAYTTEFLSDCSYTTGLPTGIGSALKSYVEYNTIVYFVDPYRETIVRAGLDGIMDMGRKYSDGIIHLIRGEKQAGTLGGIVGMYNTDTNDVLFYLPTDNNTYVYAEDVDQWVSKLPVGIIERGFSTDKTFYLAQEGDVWEVSEEAEKANYFGTQYTPNITFPVNQNANFVKTYQSLAVHCDQLMETGVDGVRTQLGHISDLLPEDFNTREGVNYANFWRDKNTDLINGDRLKGRWIVIRLQATDGNPDLNLLKVVVKSAISTPNE